jgi:hypothetical protein
VTRKKSLDAQVETAFRRPARSFKESEKFFACWYGRCSRLQAFRGLLPDDSSALTFSFPAEADRTNIAAAILRASSNFSSKSIEVRSVQDDTPHGVPPPDGIASVGAFDAGKDDFQSTKRTSSPGL